MDFEKDPYIVMDLRREGKGTMGNVDFAGFHLTDDNLKKLVHRLASAQFLEANESTVGTNTVTKFRDSSLDFFGTNVPSDTDPDQLQEVLGGPAGALHHDEIQVPHETPALEAIAYEGHPAVLDGRPDVIDDFQARMSTRNMKISHGDGLAFTGVPKHQNFTAFSPTVYQNQIETLLEQGKNQDYDEWVRSSYANLKEPDFGSSTESESESETTGLSM